MVSGVFCDIEASYKFMFLSASIILINLLSANKLMHCLAPLRHLSISRSQKLLVTMVTGVVSSIQLILQLCEIYLLDVYHAEYYVYTGACFLLLNEDNEWDWVETVDKVLSVLHRPVSCVIMILLNVALVAVAATKTRS